MSLTTFGNPGGVGRMRQPAPNPAQIQKMLDENAHLIQTIQDYQNKGKGQECLQYQQALHRNLVYLASLADGTQNIQQMLPVCKNFGHRLTVIVFSQ